MQELVSFLGPIYLFLFLFLLPWESDVRKHLYDSCENVLPMFSSRSCMRSHLMFKSLSHFEFIFVYNERVCSSFIDLHSVVQLSQPHLLKSLFPVVYSCLLCQRLIVHRCVGLFLGFLFCFIDPYVCFCASTMLF